MGILEKYRMKTKMMGRNAITGCLLGVSSGCPE
jgi:hypothetical protein